MRKALFACSRLKSLCFEQNEPLRSWFSRTFCERLDSCETAVLPFLTDDYVRTSFLFLSPFPCWAQDTGHRAQGTGYYPCSFGKLFDSLSLSLLVLTNRLLGV